MTDPIYEQKASAGLEKLGMITAGLHLDTVCQQAAAGNWSYSHFLGYLLDGEIRERHRKTVALNLQFARFPSIKRLDAFDYAAQPGLDRRIIDELATGRYLAEGRNVVFLGPPGVGKTHVAIALGVLAAEMGHRVYFTTTMDMARKLAKANDQNRLQSALNVLTQPKLLVLDEVGYLTLDRSQAGLLFQVICKRYEREQPTLVTSNKAFADWGHVFADDPIMASAALDRLVHRCTVINIRGESYRLKEQRAAGAADKRGERTMPMKGGRIDRNEEN